MDERRGSKRSFGSERKFIQLIVARRRADDRHGSVRCRPLEQWSFNGFYREIISVERRRRAQIDIHEGQVFGRRRNAGKHIEEVDNELAREASGGRGRNAGCIPLAWERSTFIGNASARRNASSRRFDGPRQARWEFVRWWRRGRL